MSGDFLPEGTPRGLPGPLPAGERILWQGAPTAGGLLLRVFHARLVAVWFAAVAVACAAAAGSAERALAVVAPTFVVGAGAIALLAVLAWLSARTTVYTITNRRLVLQIGIALPVTMNLPFAEVEGGGLRRFGDGSGDLAVQLRAGIRLAYLQLWPHARPWRVTRPEPMLRSVADAEAVARVLARALTAYAEGDAAMPVIVGRRGSDAAPGRLVAAE